MVNLVVILLFPLPSIGVAFVVQHSSLVVVCSGMPAVLTEKTPLIAKGKLVQSVMVWWANILVLKLEFQQDFEIWGLWTSAVENSL